MKCVRFCATCAMILLILEALFEHSAAHNSRNYIILYLEGYVEHSADHTLRASCVILRNLHNSSYDIIVSKHFATRAICAS